MVMTKIQNLLRPGIWVIRATRLQEDCKVHLGGFVILCGQSAVAMSSWWAN